MPIRAENTHNPEADRQAAIINNAIKLLHSKPRSQPVTCSELYASVSRHFAQEEDMINFVTLSWARVPDAIPIVDNGPGWFAAHTGFKWADAAEPQQHFITQRKPLPSQDDIKSKLVGFDSPVSCVVLFTSRTAARFFHMDLQMRWLAEREIEGLSELGGPGPFRTRAGPGRPQWWRMVIVATGADPTPAEQTFFKSCALAAGPVRVLALGNGDAKGLAAVKKVIEGSVNGPCVCHAHFYGSLYTQEIKKRKLAARLSHLLPADAIPPTAGIRKIANESKEDKELLEELCMLRDVPESETTSSDLELVQEAVVAGIGRTARELKEAGIFIPLIACCVNLLAFES